MYCVMWIKRAGKCTASDLQLGKKKFEISDLQLGKKKISTLVGRWVTSWKRARGDEKASFNHSSKKVGVMNDWLRTEQGILGSSLGGLGSQLSARQHRTPIQTIGRGSDIPPMCGNWDGWISSLCTKRKHTDKTLFSVFTRQIDWCGRFAFMYHHVFRIGR